MPQGVRRSIDKIIERVPEYAWATGNEMIKSHIELAGAKRRQGQGKGPSSDLPKEQDRFVKVHSAFRVECANVLVCTQRSRTSFA